MRKFNLFANNKMSETEADEFLRNMLQKKLDLEQKTLWAEQLEAQYGVVRADPNAVQARPLFGSTIFWRIAAGLALLLVATVGYYMLNRPPVYQQMADNLIHQDKLAYADLRKGGNDMGMERLKAIEAYQQGKYSEAVSHWTALKAGGTFSPDDQFFLAMSHLYQKEWQAAIDAFDAYAQMGGKGGRFEQECRYYQALALVKMNRLAAAKQQLQGLLQLTDSPLLKTRVEQLLKAIG